MRRRASTFCWPVRWAFRTSCVPEQGGHGGRRGAPELVEMEVRELLSKYEFRGRHADRDGLGAEGAGGDTSAIGVPSVVKLVDEMDRYIPVPERAIDGRS